MNNSIKLNILLMLVFAVKLHKVRGPLTCASPKLKECFDYKKLEGTWFEQYRTNTNWFEQTDCVRLDFHAECHEKLEVSISDYGLCSHVLTQSLGNLQFKKAVGILKGLKSGDYRIVNTDYKNFVVVYSCEINKNYKLEYAWLLTRERNPCEGTLKKYFKQLTNALPFYDTGFFHDTYQGKDCVYAKIDKANDKDDKNRNEPRRENKNNTKGRDNEKNSKRQ